MINRVAGYAGTLVSSKPTCIVVVMMGRHILKTPVHHERGHLATHTGDSARAQIDGTQEAQALIISLHTTAVLILRHSKS